MESSSYDWYTHRTDKSWESDIQMSECLNVHMIRMSHFINMSHMSAPLDMLNNFCFMCKLKMIACHADSRESDESHE